jgi:hypothetical protein
MTYDEFLTECDSNKLSTYLEVSWSNGGTSGSCWSDELSSIGAQDPQELEGLDEILEHFVPDISFLEYKILKKGIVTTDNYSEGDWYGGCENYTKISVDTKELYEYFNEKGWLDKK